MCHFRIPQPQAEIRRPIQDIPCSGPGLKTHGNLFWGMGCQRRGAWESMQEDKWMNYVQGGSIGGSCCRRGGAAMGVSTGIPPGDAQGTKNQKINVLVAPYGLDFRVIPKVIFKSFLRFRYMISPKTNVSLKFPCKLLLWCSPH